MASSRTLLLLRHAKSSWADPGMDDFDRPLNGRGRRAVRAIARMLAEADARPALVLCSPARRTRETLEGVRPGLAGEPEVRFDRALYLADADRLGDIVRGLPDVAQAMLVGHNPGLHDLARALAGAGDPALRRRLGDAFPTGALATIAFAGDWRDARDGTGRLVAYVAPRELK
ncbi:histidine phosphatase family protein [Stella sp.]|uniref:SixA phosphatase family protein n=1 Tax=Stella sp. TaxID=2912054 RepID=UPI0035B20F09